LHPEAKFAGGDYTEAGLTRRRHVTAGIVIYIGKEADDWQRRFYLGEDETSAITYGVSPDDLRRLRGRLEGGGLGTRALARAAKLSAAEVLGVRRGYRRPSAATLGRLVHGMAVLDGGIRSGGHAISRRVASIDFS
jgi:hypothetical protein